MNEGQDAGGGTWPGPPEVILDSDVAARSRDNFKDSLINCIPVLLLMGPKQY